MSRWIISSAILLVFYSFGISVASAQWYDDWYYKHLSDEFDDTVTHYASTFGTGGVLGLFCNNKHPPVITVNPKAENPPSLDGFLVRIRYRFDALPAQDDKWLWVNRSALMPLGLPIEADEFLKSLMSRETIIIRLGDGDTMRFSLRGSRQAIEKALANCD